MTWANYAVNGDLVKTNENIDEYEGLTKEQKKKKKEFDDYWYNDENFPPEWQYDPVKTKKAFDMMQKEIEEFGPFELLLTGEHTTKQWEIYQRKINLIQDAACAPMSTRYDENTLNALQATYSLENKEFNLEEGITLEALEMLKERKANHKFEKAGQIAGRYHIGEGLQALAFVGMLSGLANRNYQPDTNVPANKTQGESFGDEMLPKEASRYEEYWKKVETGESGHPGMSNADYFRWKYSDQKLAEIEAIERVNSNELINLRTQKVLYGSEDMINYEYNMIENPGPLAKLSNQPQKNFFGGRYNRNILEKDRIFFRAGDSNNPYGRWFSSEAPSSVIGVRIDEAVKVHWVNPKTGACTGDSYIDRVYAINIPKGTEIFTGPSLI